MVAGGQIVLAFAGKGERPIELGEGRLKLFEVHRIAAFDPGAGTGIERKEKAKVKGFPHRGILSRLKVGHRD